jgi:hypothetical protein
MPNHQPPNRPQPPANHPTPQLAQCSIALQNFFRGLATSKSSQAKREASVAIVCVMLKARRAYVCRVRLCVLCSAAALDHLDIASSWCRGAGRACRIVLSVDSLGQARPHMWLSF